MNKPQTYVCNASYADWIGSKLVGQFINLPKGASLLYTLIDDEIHLKQSVATIALICSCNRCNSGENISELINYINQGWLFTCTKLDTIELPMHYMVQVEFEPIEQIKLDADIKKSVEA